MKFLVFIIFIITTIATISMTIIKEPWYITIECLGYNVKTSFIMFLGGLLLLFALSYYLVRLFVKLVGIPSSLRNYYQQGNSKKQLELLENSLGAFIAQDSKALSKNCKILTRAFQTHSLTVFFQAENLLLQSELTQSSKLFNQILSNSSLEFLGYFGLMRIALLQNQHEEVLSHAYKALKVNPKSITIRKKLVEFYYHKGLLDESLVEMDNLLKITNNFCSNIKKTDIITKLANNSYNQRDYKKSWQLLEEIIDNGIQSTAILSLYCKVAKVLNKKAQAIQILEQYWNDHQNIQIIPFYIEIKGAKTAIEEFNTVKQLTSADSQNIRNLITKAQYALKARLWQETQSYLNKLSQQDSYKEEIEKLTAEFEAQMPSDK